MDCLRHNCHSRHKRTSRTIWLMRVTKLIHFVRQKGTNTNADLKLVFLVISHCKKSQTGLLLLLEDVLNFSLPISPNSPLVCKSKRAILLNFSKAKENRVHGKVSFINLVRASELFTMQKLEIGKKLAKIGNDLKIKFELLIPCSETIRVQITQKSIVFKCVGRERWPIPLV